MKRTSGGRPKNADVLTHKRALIRSLIEQTGWDKDLARTGTKKSALAEEPKLAPIIPFPLNGKLEVEG